MKKHSWLDYPLSTDWWCLIIGGGVLLIALLMFIFG